MNDRPTAKKKGRGGARFLEHYPQLLLCVYAWRYVSSREVQLVLAERYPDSRSTVNYQLARLVDQGLLKTAPRLDPTRPKTYSITPAGLRRVNKHFGWQLPASIARDGAVHPLLLDHELELSRFQSDLFVEASTRPDVQIPWFERRYFRADKRLPTGAEKWFEPDLGFPVVEERADGSRTVTLYLCEWDRGRQTVAAIREKIVAGDRWYGHAGERMLGELNRQYGAADQPSRWRRLIVTSHRRSGSDFDRLVQLYTEALRVGESARNIFLTTHQLIRQHREHGAVTTAQIWYPVYRFRQAWRREIADELTASLRPQRAYRYVADRLAELEPTWSLFPPAEARTANCCFMEASALACHSRSRSQAA